VRLVGVGVVNLGPAGESQLSLFEPGGAGVRRERLNRALDTIAQRFGRGALVRGIEEPVERAGLTLQIKRGEEDPDP
jgi:hypothetical protein